MPLRPSPRPGDYIQTKPQPTRIVCKGYSQPPSCGGSYLGSLSSGIYIGPIVATEKTDRFVTVLIDGWWINIWRAKRDRSLKRPHERRFSSEGVVYAHVITREEACLWERNGWSFRYRGEPDMYTAATAC